MQCRLPCNDDAGQYNPVTSHVGGDGGGDREELLKQLGWLRVAVCKLTNVLGFLRESVTVEDQRGFDMLGQYVDFVGDLLLRRLGSTSTCSMGYGNVVRSS